MSPLTGSNQDMHADPQKTQPPLTRGAEQATEEEHDQPNHIYNHETDRRS